MWFKKKNNQKPEAKYRISTCEIKIDINEQEIEILTKGGPKFQLTAKDYRHRTSRDGCFVLGGYLRSDQKALMPIKLRDYGGGVSGTYHDYNGGLHFTDINGDEIWVPNSEITAIIKKPKRVAETVSFTVDSLEEINGRPVSI